MQHLPGHIRGIVRCQEDVACCNLLRPSLCLLLRGPAWLSHVAGTAGRHAAYHGERRLRGWPCREAADDSGPGRMRFRGHSLVRYHAPSVTTSGAAFQPTTIRLQTAVERDEPMARPLHMDRRSWRSVVEPGGEVSENDVAPATARTAREDLFQPRRPTASRSSATRSANRPRNLQVTARRFELDRTIPADGGGQARGAARTLR
jgi:hypothetical protein